MSTKEKVCGYRKSTKRNGSVEIAKEVIKIYKTIFKTDSEIRKESGRTQSEACDHRKKEQYVQEQCQWSTKHRGNI